MAARHSDRFSPPPRRNSSSNPSSSNFQPRGIAPPPPSWDRYSRDRSYPPRHYTPYDEPENDQISSNSSFRQSYPPPRHHTPYSDHEIGLNGQGSSYRPSQTSLPQQTVKFEVANSSQGINRKSVNPASNTSNAPQHRKTLSNSDLPSLRKTPNSTKAMPVTPTVGSTRSQEDIFKKMLDTVTDITQLKIDSAKAAVKLEASRQKYEKNTSHYAKFPVIKSTLQNELDKARIAVENINEKMTRKDAVFQELAGQALPILLPALETCELRTKVPHSEDLELFKKLENVVHKVEQQCTELQQEFKRSLEEQSAHQTMKDKQYSNLERKLQEMISTDLGRRKENTELRIQLRTLSDEFSSFKKEILTYRQEALVAKEISDLTAKDITRVEKHMIQSDKESQKKFEYFGARIEPISSMDSNLRTLLENGLLEVKASTIESFSSSLNAAVNRLDCLPGASAYSSLNSRLAYLEKERVPTSLSTQITDLKNLDCDNRLKALEFKATVMENTEITSPSVILALQNQVQALSKHIALISPANSSEISSLRSLTESVQKSLNVVQINVASLHKRLPSNIDSLDDAKSSNNLSDLNRKFVELSTTVAASSHSLDNLTARVDNITTGHLAQAILHQLSEAYPHIQNFEQLVVTQGEKIREIQKNMNHLSSEISGVLLASQAQIAAQTQPVISRTSTSISRNFGEEIDKISENVSKAISDIKKLAAAADDDRSYISEKLELRLGSLVDCADLKTQQIELTNLLKTQIQNSLDEYTKNVVTPQLEKLENFSDSRNSLERRLKDDFNTALNEENATMASKLQQDLIVIRDDLKGQISTTLQEQKKELEELVIAQVDRSLTSSRPEFTKQAAKRVKSKTLVIEESANLSRAVSHSDSPPVTTPTTSVSNLVALTPSASTTGHVINNPTTSTGINSSQIDNASSLSSVKNGSQQNASMKSQNSETHKKKRKLVNLKSGSPRIANGSRSPTIKRIRRTPNAIGSEKLPPRVPKSERE